MAVAYAEIARVLDGARRRQGWVVLATALGWGSAGSLGALLGGALLLAHGPGGVARGLSLALATVSLVAGVTWASIVLLRTARGPSAVARVVGRAGEGLHSDLMSSVELQREYTDLERTRRFSLALVDAHIERTARRARAVDLARLIPSAPVRRAGVALVAVLAGNLVAGVVEGRPLLGAYARLLRGERAARTDPRADPITGDIEITYLFPAYMRRAPKTLSGTGGEVTAPSGTEVRLRTRADRPVGDAQILVAAGDPKAARSYALEVKGGRDLSGRFVVEAGGSYRFRFLRAGRELAIGPPIPIAVEPDAFPEVRITAPAAEVEVDAKARVRVEWTASDDYGLTDLTLVTKSPGGGEERRTLSTFAATRREAGGFDVDLGPLRLAEGEKLLYWLEVRDNDAVSGPKRAASATHAIKIYSEAEHHRALLEKAMALWEQMVGLLGERLEFLEKPRPIAERLALGESYDIRTRQLHEAIRAAAAEMRRERGAPREVPAALVNVAGGIRSAEQRLTSARELLSRMARFGSGIATAQSHLVESLDGELNSELEKDVLYLEELFDKRRAEDLVQMAKDLSARRRDLASLLERYRAAPTEEGKKQILAEIARLKQRMQELVRRMGELAKGISDEHMNAEALAELSKSSDLAGGLDRVEEKLARGDLEGALKDLDALGSSMQQMLSQLERTAGLPDERNAELMREMLAFKKDLEAIQSEQEKLAQETDRVKAEYRKRIAERLRSAEALSKKLAALVAEAQREVAGAEPGVDLRSEDDFGQSRGRLADLERALAMRDLDAALQSARRALPAMQRLAMGLEDEATIAERYRTLTQKDPWVIREAQRHAAAALPPGRKVLDELEKLFPDPRSLLGGRDQAKLEALAKRQGELEGRAGGLKRDLDALQQRAPVFPPSAGQNLGESRGHMLQAAGELAQRNPQRGHGEQREALDALARLRRGLDELAKGGRGRDGGGFPFPFGEEPGGGNEEGAMGDPSREKVEIPGAEAYKVPEEFRKDLLDAMKQGAPEPYKGEVQRYYEELVK